MPWVNKPRSPGGLKGRESLIRELGRLRKKLS
jgi:hypothetical protein